MKIEYDKNLKYYVADEAGKVIGCGDTPLEAACEAATSEFRPHSLYWYRMVAGLIESSDPDVLNGTPGC